MRLKNTFIQGKLNKDIDERLLPKGQYPHAENIRVANTDSSDMGAVENVKGNEKLTLFNLTNAKTIGAFSDDSNQKLYWFTTSDEKDVVVEYDFLNSVSTILLESSKPNSLLNFDKNQLITGIVKIINGDSDKDLLVWTDDVNPPRVINIERAKTYDVDGFIEEDISLIKKPPRFAPIVNLTFTSTTLENNLKDKFLSFAYRYKYLDGEYSALSSFSNYKFAPEQFGLDYQTMENEGMINSFNAVNINFNTGSKRVTDIELVFKESNSNNVSVIERFNKEKEGWGDNETRDFKFSNSKKYISLPEDELFRTYDNVPLLAKSLDIIGNRLVFGNYVDGYDLVNVFGQPVNIDYNVSTIYKELLGEEIAVETTNTSINDDTLIIDLSNISLVSGSRISIDIDLNESGGDGKFNESFDFIFNKDYSTGQELSEDEDFIFFVESVMTNKFLQEYTNTPPNDSEVTSNTTFTIHSATNTSISIKAVTVEYTIDNTPADITDNPANTTIENRNWFFGLNTSVFFKNIAIDTSLKTNRSYEVGIIYMDEFGRATTVLTDSNNTQYIDQQYSIYQNKLLVNINHIPPVWADRYKMVVKQNKGDYQTIYSNIFYEDGLFRWVKLEGANKDKVKEGDTLIVKSDLGGVVQDVIKVRVLEISTKDKNFIEGNETIEGSEIIEGSGLYMKIKPVGFDMNANDATQRTFQGSSHLRYPTRTYTSPSFGTVDNADNYNPLALGAGSTVRLYIKFKARGKIAYEEVYDKEYKINSDYTSVKEWFDTEVQDLGSFGRNFTRGVDGADGEYGYGYGFSELGQDGYTRNGESFYVWAHRNGTASRNITTEVRFEIRFSEGTVIFETEPDDQDSDIFYETEQTFEILDNKHQGNIINQTDFVPATVELDFFNCFVQGNGAESYRFKDAFNSKKLSIDLRPTSTSIEEYKQVRRYADLTYSEPYNENNNVNGINEFNLSKANYKEDIDKKYGYIQKLYSRDTDLIVFQEDKVSKVLYGKDLLMNADGTSNVTSIDTVLGQQIPFKGEYGISRNPESFAYDGYNIYFTDSKRGAVMRLGNNGLQEISNNGLRQFFRDNFKNSIDNEKIGAFDPYQDQYVIHPSLNVLSLPMSISCGNNVVKNNFSGELVVNIDYGLLTGNTNIGYNISGDSEIVASLEYNDEVVYTGTISDLGNIELDKNSSNPSVAKLKLTVDICSSFEISTSCIEAQELSVTNIVINDEGDLDLTIKNRYRWSNDSYVSPLISKQSVFTEDEINLFTVIVGDEGVGMIPTRGGTIYIDSYKDSVSTGNFSEGDRLGYLITDTVYQEQDLETILNQAIFPEVTESVSLSGEVVNSISFDYVGEQSSRLYLIWDYTQKNQAPVAVDDNVSVNKGDGVIINVVSNDSDPDGDVLTPIIVSQPLYGSVQVNLDGTITYTHNDSENFLDSFTYKLTDGTVESNVATVSIAVGVGVGDSITANGGTGIFLIPIVVGTGEGDLVVHFNAQSVPDRLEVLFDPNSNPNNVSDVANMPVVADSLFVGDSVVSNQNTPVNGAVSGLDLNLYNGSTFDVVETGTQTITITDSIVASNSGNRTANTPNGESRNSSGASQVGVQDLVFTSSNDVIGSTGLNYADGNIALRYSKPASTSYIAYLRVSGVSGTAWTIYKTEFI
jgi:hypothetical protein